VELPMLKKLFWAIVIFLIGTLTVWAQNADTPGTIVVAPGQIGVVFNIVTGDLLDPLEPGTHQIDPLTQTVTLYPTDQQAYTMAGTGEDGAVLARTLDGLEIAIDITVIYSLDPTHINSIHVRWGDRYPDALVRPVTRTIIRDAVSLFEAARIYAEDRIAFAAAVEEQLTRRLGQENLIVSDIFISDIQFPEAFRDALEQRALAEAAVASARLEVERRQLEAEAVAIRARGLAEVWAILSPLLAENPLFSSLHDIDTLAAYVMALIGTPPVTPDTD
jgi:regulator of protease activity HflC (stomatin/prohibitin superfamily)